MGAVTEVSQLWDAVVSDFLHTGEHRFPSPLDRWFDGYSGEVDLRSFPEPFIGGLDGEPAMVFLGLNPGKGVASVSGTGRPVRREIEELGSYTAWAATLPYLRHPYLQRGRNGFHYDRLRFNASVEQ